MFLLVRFCLMNLLLLYGNFTEIYMDVWSITANYPTSRKQQLPLPFQKQWWKQGWRWADSFSFSNIWKMYQLLLQRRHQTWVFCTIKTFRTWSCKHLCIQLYSHKEVSTVKSMFAALAPFVSDAEKLIWTEWHQQFIVWNLKTWLIPEW